MRQFCGMVLVVAHTMNVIIALGAATSIFSCGATGGLLLSFGKKHCPGYLHETLHNVYSVLP